MIYKNHKAIVAERESVSTRLQIGRLTLNLSIADIAAKTKIASRYLIAIEQGQFSTLPSRAHTLGFVRNYARVVGLDGNEVVSALRCEIAAPREQLQAIVTHSPPESISHRFRRAMTFGWM